MKKTIQTAVTTGALCLAAQGAGARAEALEYRPGDETPALRRGAAEAGCQPRTWAVGRSATSQRMATNAAIEAWRRKVAAHFGPQYAAWPQAMGRDLSCPPSDHGYVCRASAMPCLSR